MGKNSKFRLADLVNIMSEKTGEFKVSDVHQIVKLIFHDATEKSVRNHLKTLDEAMVISKTITNRRMVTFTFKLGLKSRFEGAEDGIADIRTQISNKRKCRINAAPRFNSSGNRIVAWGESENGKRFAPKAGQTVTMMGA